MNNKTERLLYLDGLRGVAAVLVVIHHFMIGFYPASYSRSVGDIHTRHAIEWLLHDTPLGIVINGGFAVAIFLLLSGFVASIQFRRGQTPQAVSESIIKRFLRFFLPLFVINLIAFGLLYFDQRWNLKAAVFTQSYWWLGQMWNTKASLVTAISQSFGSLFQAYPLGEVYNSSVWTMPFFFLGAMVISLTLLLTSHIPKRWLIYVLLTLVFIKTNYWLFFVGMMVEQYSEFFKRLFSKLFIRISMLPLIVFLGNYPQYYSTADATSWYGWLPILSFAHTSSFYQGVAAFLLLLFLIHTQLAQKIVSHRFWLFLGKISFSLYLFHILIINTLTSWLFVRFLSLYSYSASLLLSILLSLPFIILGSWLIYNVTESKTSTVYLYVRKWLLQ